MAEALRTVFPRIFQNNDVKIAIEVLVSFLELVSGHDADTCVLPYGPVLGFMSMEAMPCVKVVGNNGAGLTNDCVLPRPSADGSCNMTRIIRTGALPTLHRRTLHTYLFVVPLHRCHLRIQFVVRCVGAA